LKGLNCSFIRSSPHWRDYGTLKDRRRNVRQSCGVTRAASAELPAESSGTIIRKRDKVTTSVKLLSKTIKQLVESGEKGKTKVDSGELYCDTPLNQDFLDSDRSMCRAVSRYNPDKVKEEAERDLTAVALRTAKIAAAFGSFWVRRETVWKGAQEREGREVDTAAVQAEATCLRKILGDLGPTFVKLGQNLGNRPDLLRADYMEELTKLQDRVPPFPDSIAKQMIIDQIGGPLEETFSEFNEVAVAAASLGQVYKGRLRSNGEEVAVKVQRPGVRPKVIIDLYLLREVAERSLNDYAKKNIGCEATLLVDEFAEKLLEELDYEQEARNLQDFYRNFESDARVRIPFVYRELSGPMVLVMEWIDGVRCTDPLAFDNDDAKRRFISIGVEAGLKQLLESGLFHGDPHPGNVLALRNGNIGYVDFGNVAEISRQNQECLIDAVVHAMNADYEGLAADLTNLGFLSPGVDVKPIAGALQEAWGVSLRADGLADFSFRNLTNQFNKLLFLYPIRVPERFSLVIRSLLTQEGICITLDPDYNFLEVAFPYVAKRLLTDSNPALRLRLLQVVIVDGAFDWARLKQLIAVANDSKSGESLLDNLDLGPVVWDSIMMLRKDKKMRDEILKGFSSQPLWVHIRELKGLLMLLSGIFKNQMQTWWKMRVRTWTSSFRQLLGILGIKKKPLPTSAPAAT